MTKKNESNAEQQEIAPENQFCANNDALAQFARTHPERLALCGFTPEMAAAFSTSLLLHKSNNNSFQEARGYFAQKRRLTKKAFAETTDFRQTLNLGFALVGKNEKVVTPPVRKRAVLADDPQLALVWLQQVRPDVVLFAGPLALPMGQPVARLDATEAKLSTAVLSEQAAKAALEERREALSDSRAEVMRSVELLRLAGRAAFKGQPAQLKKLSWRAGVHPRKQKKQTPAKA
jgi:hypothetical protein